MDPIVSVEPEDAPDSYVPPAKFWKAVKVGSSGSSLEEPMSPLLVVPVTEEVKAK